MNINMLQAVVAPGVDAEVWYVPLAAAAEEFGILDPLDQAAFLANAAHESMGFTDFEENLNYSWHALLKQWPNRFTPEHAIAVGRVSKTEIYDGQQGVVWGGMFYPTTVHPSNQPTIANTAYGNRNGNNSEGDGWRFRGRGCFQLTFLNNYLEFSQYIQDPLVMNHPELVAENPDYVCRSAAHFWFKRGLSQVLQQRGFEAVAKRINGGTIGMDDRIAKFQKTSAFA